MLSQQFFFNELPTYENLVSGTGSKLPILFELKQEYESSKERFVDPRGIEPLSRLCHSHILPVYYGPKET
jgi:hypothetical protein